MAKTRVSRVMTDSLVSKLDDSESEDRANLYAPVKSEKSDFFDLVGEAMLESEEVVQPTKKKTISGELILGVLASLVVIIVAVLIIDGIFL